jgi:hypothetical protein
MWNRSSLVVSGADDCQVLPPSRVAVTLALPIPAATIPAPVTGRALPILGLAPLGTDERAAVRAGPAVGSGSTSHYNRVAVANGKPVLAAPASPDVAQCPACGGEVCKRRRTDGGRTTWFYRHRQGVGDGCPRRYRPVPEA